MPPLLILQLEHGIPSTTYMLIHINIIQGPGLQRSFIFDAASKVIVIPLFLFSGVFNFMNQV